jgi:hypothetical protein
VPRLEELREEMRLGAERRDRTIVACAAGLAGVLWIALGAEPGWLGPVALIGAVALYFSRRDAAPR